MGDYTKNLFKRKRKPKYQGEYLTACAIKRDDEVHHGFKTHWELRASLGDEDCVHSGLGDIEGFWTSEGRFVTRDEAKPIVDAAGQGLVSSRKLLSSDINWWSQQ